MFDLRRLAFPTSRTLQRWESERSKGALRFVLLKGVVFFGVLIYGFGSAIIYFGGWGELPLRLQFGGGPVLAFGVFLLVGLVWGVFTWATTEVAYGSHRHRPIRF